MTDPSGQNSPPVPASGHPCLAVVADHRNGGRPTRCKKVDADKPMAYRGENWCCDQHRKLVVAQGDLMEISSTDPEEPPRLVWRSDGPRDETIVGPL